MLTRIFRKKLIQNNINKRSKGIFHKNFNNLRRFYAKKDDLLKDVRNIGISAHIDSGKTTLTERILYFTGKISDIHEVKGKDGVGAKMDSMDLEREKGITIKSAATNVYWKDNFINIIDTPGHVDFTIEVERSLRVLDGAILVLCGVSGVQSQTITVDRQMRRYDVSRVIFINKLDRLGADPWKVLKGVKEKLAINCAAVQIPIGVSHNHKGVIDIITKKAYVFSGGKGEKLIEEDVPENLEGQVEEKRNMLIESLLDIDDIFANKVLEGEVTPEDIKASIRRCVIARKFVPVFMGSAVKNKGVQNLLDGVVDYLPSPLDRKIVGFDKSKNGEQVDLSPNPKLPLVALAFKLEENKFGQLTWIRVYQGTLKKLQTILNTSIQEKIKVPRLAKMHSEELEDINEVKAGDICAMFGVECASGETFTDGTVNIQMNPMFVPTPVVSLGITVKSKQQSHLLTKALKRFEREDPTFRVSVDPDTKEMLISGMGELHLEIYVERMKREYQIATKVGAPKVAYRETIQTAGRVPFNYLHKKQSGGSGQYAKIIGYIEALPEGEGLACKFINKLVGQNIPPNFVPAIQKGFEDSIAKGPLIGNPIEGIQFVLTDGDHHPVDSSELAFRICTHYAFTQAFMEANPSLLQPIMNVEIRTPSEYQQAVLSTINKRKGAINNSVLDGPSVTIHAEVPLANLFGYASDLRSVTEGKGEFTMEYMKHDYVYPQDTEKIIEQYQKDKKNIEQ